MVCLRFVITTSNPQYNISRILIVFREMVEHRPIRGLATSLKADQVGSSGRTGLGKRSKSRQSSGLGRSRTCDHFQMCSLFYLQERHHNMLQYQIPSGVMPLANVFGCIESAQEALDIEDYSVSQTTLDNVRTTCLSGERLTCATERKNTKHVVF